MFNSFEKIYFFNEELCSNAVILTVCSELGGATRHF